MALQSYLAFKKADVKAALEVTVSMKRADDAQWQFDKVQPQVFVSEVVKLIMLMLRHVSQASLRTKPPKLYLEVFRTTASLKVEPEIAKCAQVCDWCFGYSREQEAAWRCDPKTQFEKQFTTTFLAGARPLDSVIAEWLDGVRYAIAELTTASLKAQRIQR